MRLPAHPAGVPAARRFVGDGLRAWRRRDLLDDASVVVSELASNAVLHSGSSFFDVVMEPLAAGVRVSVYEEGPVPAVAVVPRLSALACRGTGHEAVLDDEPTTGRGLLLVELFAAAWGIEETGVGKRVWVDLLRSEDAPRPIPPERVWAAPKGLDLTSLPPGWHVVRLLDCPVELSLRQDQHLDELIRELQLIQARPGLRPARDLTRVMTDLLGRHAQARHMGRRMALDAGAAGHAVVTISLPVPASASKDVQDLHRAVQHANVLCDQQRLLTLASTPQVQSVRQWMVDEFVAQIERGDAPTPYRPL
ncbi:MAG: ATP-binding protein [Propionibacteriales bacterium]|nr:ATP-binding protein [Propionibacteriales bacterium]